MSAMNEVEVGPEEWRLFDDASGNRRLDARPGIVPNTSQARHGVPAQFGRSEKKAPSVPKPTMGFLQAAENANIEQIKRHIHWGSDVNVRGRGGETPVHWAVFKHHCEMLQLLLKCGPNLDIRDLDGATPLTLSLNSRDLKTADLLLQHGARLSAGGTGGDPPLVDAMRRSSWDVMRWLLSRGADPHGCDRRGNPLVHTACTYNKPEALRILVDYAVDFNALNTEGFTPLGSVVENERWFAFEFLIEQGIDVHVRDAHGSTPLLLAGRQGVEFARRLLERGAQVNTCGSGNYWRPGWTPLHVAACVGNTEVALLLLEHNASLDARNDEGHTPRDVAAENGHRSLARRLSRKGLCRCVDALKSSLGM